MKKLRSVLITPSAIIDLRSVDAFYIKMELHSDEFVLFACHKSGKEIPVYHSFNLPEVESALEEVKSILEEIYTEGIGYEQ